MKNTIRVVWLCYFSNPLVRNLAKRNIPIINKFCKKTVSLVFDSDFAQWNTNAVYELRRFPEIELHIVCPVPYLTSNSQCVYNEGCYYHFIKDERMSLQYRLLKRICKKNVAKYRNNRRRILREIQSIAPDIVHIIGAENDYYASAATDIPSNIPLIVQLQTLINDPKFLEGYLFDEQSYIDACNHEAQILARADYIGTTVAYYKEIIKNKINNKAHFIPIRLAVGPRFCKNILPKMYDCIYFASNIEKSADLAIEAFIRAKHQLPNISMIIIGGCSDVFKKKLETLLLENGIKDSVTFLGRLKSYSEVLEYVQHSRCALLPLKVDFIASTIREAMALGIPTISTITDGTPSLNEKRRSILLSNIGDHDQLAENLIKVLTNSELYSELRNNAFQTIEEKYSNKAIINEWINAYKTILCKRYDSN